jgi:molecular chaperone GrpE
MIQRKFDNVLEQYNIEVIDPVGEVFDPNYHEAIGTDDSDDVESGHVTVTLQKGYKAGEQILRPALVRVAS